MIHISSYHSNGLQPVVWPNKVNLIGEKVYKPKIHFCEHCEKPILIYGRLIPCKHVFCFSCATLCLNQQQQQQPPTPNNGTTNLDTSPTATATVSVGKGCHRCGNRALRAERNTLNSIFVCQIETCRRTYLSARDLQAHFNHRHSKNKSHNSNGNSSASMVAISSSPYITSSSLMHLNSSTNQNSGTSHNHNHHNHHHHRQSSSSTSTTNNTSSNPNNNNSSSSPSKHKTTYHGRDRDRDRERDNKEYHRQSIQRAAQWAEASAQMLEKGLTR